MDSLSYNTLTVRNNQSVTVYNQENNQESIEKLGYSKYDYIKVNPRKVRIVYFITFISWILSSVGMWHFFQLNPWYMVALLPLFVPILFSRTVTYFVNSFYPGFNLKEHDKLVREYWQNIKKFPSVDIFLPICGEDVEILKETWKAVSKIKYPNKQVYVLEDKVDPDARALAEKYGFNYLSRPNKGEYKKSGNLKYGYENSNGEFVVIFDADFVPHPDFLTELLPYMRDSRTGIIQTPQYFVNNKEIHKKSPIQYGAANVVDDFYQIIQPSRDFFGAAICVGTNAIYRRQAMYDAQAPQVVERSEDVVTGLNLLKYDYELKYIPLVLAAGICPDNIEAYFKQHNRWCTGSVLLLFSSFFWRIKMTAAQRIIFAAGPIYYIAESVTPLISVQLYLLLLLHFDSISIGHMLWFIPYLIMYRFVAPSLKVTPTRRGTILAAMTHIFTYTYSILTIIFNNMMEWVPTNAKQETISNRFLRIAEISIVYFNIWIILTALVFWVHPDILKNINAYPLLFWVFYSIFTYGFYTISILGEINGSIRAAAKAGVSSLRLKLWSSRLAFQNVFLILGLFTVLGFTQYQQFYVANAAPIQGGQVAGVQEAREVALDGEIKNPTVVEVAEDAFIVTTGSTDTYSTVVRKAILAYEEVRGKKLDAYQRAYIESKIVLANGKPDVSQGDQVKITKAELEKMASLTSAMSEEDKKIWTEVAFGLDYTL